MTEESNIFRSPLTEEIAETSLGEVTRIGTADLSRRHLRMAVDRVRGGYPWVLGPAGLGLGMIFHPRFSGSGPRNQSGSVSGLVFHPWISNGYPK